MNEKLVSIPKASFKQLSYCQLQLVDLEYYIYEILEKPEIINGFEKWQKENNNGK